MQTIIYQATIQINPKTKKNSQNIYFNRAKGRRFISQSDSYKAYERECAAFLHDKGIKIDFPINLQAVYYRKDRRRVDLANLHEALLDILTKYEILADDNAKIVVSMDGSRVFYDKEHPRTEIVITRAEDDDK